MNRLFNRFSTAVALWVFLSLAFVLGANPGIADPAAKPVPLAADVSYGPFAHQLLDVYVPPGTGPFPVVVWYGTIWKAGKGALGDLGRLLSKNCSVVAVEVRTMEDATADKAAVPISYVLLDARRSVQFVRMHAAEYHLDPNRIATAGSSQGSLPALYVACAGEKADPGAVDPVARISTKVTCVGAFRSQPSIDPKVMQDWVPGVEWGAPALGYGFKESLLKRDELLPIIQEWSPDALLHKGTPPIYFYNNWGLTKPQEPSEADYRVHSPRWALGFQQVAEAHAVTCYVDFPGHPPAKYRDMWDFLVGELNAPLR